MKVYRDYAISRHTREEIAHMRARIVECAVELGRAHSEGKFDRFQVLQTRLLIRVHEYLEYLEQIDIEYS